MSTISKQEEKPAEAQLTEEEETLERMKVANPGWYQLLEKGGKNKNLDIGEVDCCVMGELHGLG